MRADDFGFVWNTLKPCSEKQAEYISMKLSQMKVRCCDCKNCIGEKCDIYTSSKEEAMLGKYLLENHLKGGYMKIKYTTTEVALNNVKYALVVEGGGWVCKHELLLLMNNGDVYITDTWKAEDIIPEKTVCAMYLGIIDNMGEFTIPKDIHRGVMDAPEHIVYDSSLEKPIYNAYGVEKEFESYFAPVFSLREEFYDWRKQ